MPNHQILPHTTHCYPNTHFINKTECIFENNQNAGCNYFLDLDLRFCCTLPDFGWACPHGPNLVCWLIACLLTEKCNCSAVFLSVFFQQIQIYILRNVILQLYLGLCAKYNVESQFVCKSTI